MWSSGRHHRPQRKAVPGLAAMRGQAAFTGSGSVFFCSSGDNGETIAIRLEAIALRLEAITNRNKQEERTRSFLGAPGFPTRSKDATRGSWRLLAVI